MTPSSVQDTRSGTGAIRSLRGGGTRGEAHFFAVQIDGDRKSCFRGSPGEGHAGDAQAAQFDAEVGRRGTGRKKVDGAVLIPGRVSFHDRIVDPLVEPVGV